ncbi:MAG: glutamyl-tRNA reductase [Saprospiraceae bacterium]
MTNAAYPKDTFAAYQWYKSKLMILSSYKILTITHRHASLHEIGQFVISPQGSDILKDKLIELKEEMKLQELLYLATCNRVLFFFDRAVKTSETFIVDFLQAMYPEIQAAEIEKMSTRFQLLEGHQAIQHLLEVSASVDSLVVGEREILRQLREAQEQCSAWGLTGDNIRLAMRSVVEGAKEVYAKTRIGEKPISVVSLAMTSMLDAGARNDQRVLLIGAGQTNLLVCKFLKKWGFNNVSVFNRNMVRANALAQMVNGNACSLDELPNHKDGFDIIIICTSSDAAIIDSELYQKLLVGEQDQKLLVDLSVPYNIEKSVVENFPCKYIEIEGLKKMAESNMEFRRREIDHARELIDANLNCFESNYKTRQIEKAFSGIPEEIKAISQNAIDKVFKKELATLDESSRNIALKMMAYMEKRCISVPMKAVKEMVE